VSYCSESSLEHLSAEERACLMFLEETIESLEAEDDSGLSSDEPKRSSVLLPYPSNQRSKQDGELRVLDSGQNVPIDKLDAIPVPPAFASTVHLSQDKVDTASMPKTSAGTQTNHTPQTIPSEMNIVLIPPPSDFQDEPAAQTEQHITRQPKVKIDLEQFCKRASVKKASVATSETKANPPAVAPKPKKLPPNIVMKTHKTSDSSGSSPVTSPNERVMMDPQKVRLEALRKLGLLKDAEVDSGSPTSPLHYPSSLRSREEMSEPQSRPSPPSGHCGYPGTDVLTATVQLPIKLPEVKSASLERSDTANQVSSNSFHGSSTADAASHSFISPKPRPASLGNSPATKALELGDVGKSAAPTPPAQILVSHKLPRSQGVSVLISPRGENGGNRREALRKLGLLKE
uniref:Specifically androgen-regulated protein-like n=1 Tax=Scleropages formosus TaxID=113540 RepID=A0A8C9TPK2_SCLFO